MKLMKMACLLVLGWWVLKLEGFDESLELEQIFAFALVGSRVGLAVQLKGLAKASTGSVVAVPDP